MAITRKEKESLLQEYSEALQASRAIFLANYTGLTMQEMERVRGELRRDETEIEVLRNRLFGLVAKEAGIESIQDILMGPTLAIFCKGDPTSPAKTLFNLSKNMEELNFYSGLLGGNTISPAQFEMLANLPSREELLAKMMGSLQAPIYGFVGVLSAVLRSLLYVLQARADQLQGEASGEAA